MTTTEAKRGALLGLGIAVAVLGGVTVIVAGVALGGPWRWAAGVTTVIGIATIAVPGFVKDKNSNDFEEKR